MKPGDPHFPESGSASDSNEQRLRREVEDLKRRLGEREQSHIPLHSPVWRPSGVTITALLLIGVVVLLGAFFGGYLPLQRRDSTVVAEAVLSDKAIPQMEVIHVRRAAAQGGLVLPGTMQAVTEVPVLARTDGYLKSRLVDIGDRVRAGQTLAELDAPELDQQIHQAEASVTQAEAGLEQAQASLAQGKANLELARITAERWKSLAADGVVSRQDNDQYQAQFTAQTANVQSLEKAVAAQRSNVVANQANLARLKELHAYLVVKAPFDGVITVRNVDVGALITTGTTLLYRIAQTSTLRTFVNVPQVNTNSVHVGQPAQLTLSNFPGRHFSGKITRTANALDPASRTMLVEVDLPNPDGSLYPGMYAEVDLNAIRPESPIVIPAQALVIRSDGAQVAEVADDGAVHIRKVTIGRDYGDRVEVAQGLPDGATILAAPGDVTEGTKIAPVETGAAPPDRSH